MTSGEDKDMNMDIVDNGHRHDGHGYGGHGHGGHRHGGLDIVGMDMVDNGHGHDRHGHGGLVNFDIMDMDMVASCNIAKNSISEGT